MSRCAEDGVLALRSELRLTRKKPRQIGLPGLRNNQTTKGKAADSYDRGLLRAEDRGHLAPCSKPGKAAGIEALRDQACEGERSKRLGR